MLKVNKKMSIRWLIFGLIIIILLLPARFFQLFSITFFNVESNIAVNYVNFVDLLIAVTGFLCFFLEPRQVFIKKSKVIFVFPLISSICLLGLIIKGRTEYCGELISKTIILCSTIIIANYVLFNFSAKEICYLLLIPLMILVVASFFLRDYGGYETSNRVGTIGFGSNEAASFACMIVLSILFVKNMNKFIKILLIIICFGCILITSSRRALIIISLILILFFIGKMIIFFRKKRIRVRSLIIAPSIFILALFIFFLNLNEIVEFIQSTPLFVRLSYTNRIGERLFDFGERINIYSVVFEKISSSPFIGTCGCDLLLAQGSFSHSHNIFLQLFATYGLILGGVIVAYFIYTFLNVIYIVKIKKQLLSILIFPISIYVMYIIGDQFGYLLWNPKGLFLIVFCMVLINSYKSYMLIYKNMKEE